MLQNLLIRNAIIFISAFKEKGVCTLRGRNEERKEEGKWGIKEGGKKGGREGRREERKKLVRNFVARKFLPVN